MVLGSSTRVSVETAGIPQQQEYSRTNRRRPWTLGVPSTPRAPEGSARAEAGGRWTDSCFADSAAPRGGAAHSLRGL